MRYEFRFSPQATSLLVGAGWSPGRRVEFPFDDTDAVAVGANPLALVLLHEFGGITIDLNNLPFRWRNYDAGAGPPLFGRRREPNDLVIESMVDTSLEQLQEEMAFFRWRYLELEKEFGELSRIGRDNLGCREWYVDVNGRVLTFAPDMNKSPVVVMGSCFNEALENICTRRFRCRTLASSKLLPVRTIVEGDWIHPEFLSVGGSSSGDEKEFSLEILDVVAAWVYRNLIGVPQYTQIPGLAEQIISCFRQGELETRKTLLLTAQKKSDNELGLAPITRWLKRTVFGIGKTQVKYVWTKVASIERLHRGRVLRIRGKCLAVS